MIKKVLKITVIIVIIALIVAAITLIIIGLLPEEERNVCSGEHCAASYNYFKNLLSIL